MKTMMNECGFFSVIGICFLLIAAIFVKGVQESEKNYSYITTDFQTETELQNIADSALMEAVNMIELNEITLQESSQNVYNRRLNQHEITLKNHYDADVKVFYEYGKYSEWDYDKVTQTIKLFEYGKIHRMKREYKSGDKINDKAVDDADKKGVIIISVASRGTDNGKVYRRAMGYFLTDEDADGKIYFMNSL